MQMYLGTRQKKDGTVQPPAKSAAAALNELPTPTGGVTLNVAGGELVAVFKFDGYITPGTAERARKQLMDALESGESMMGCCSGPLDLKPFFVQMG